MEIFKGDSNMIFRVEKTKNYTVMSNYHLREKNMSLKAKGLLSWMLSNDDEWDYSVQGIVSCCKENETAITSALEELESFGYLVREKLMPESRILEDGTKEVIRSRIEYNYIVYEIPTQQHTIQHTENLATEFELEENPVQRNTKEINTNKEIKNNNSILKNTTATQSLDNNSNTDNNIPKRRIHLGDDISEKEYEEEKPKRRMNLYEKCAAEVESFTDNPDLRASLYNYLSIRLKMKDKPILGVGQWKGLLKTLKSLDGDKVKIVDRATERGWASFYTLDDLKYSKKNKTDYSVFGETAEMKNVLPSEVEGGEFSGQVF